MTDKALATQLDPAVRAKLTTRAALASVSMALLLLAAKAWAVIQTGSVAMLGSLADTALDVIASIITLLGVRWAAMPADREHRFGHGKAEALAALIQVVLITISALGIAWRSIQRLGSGEGTTGFESGVAVSIAAMCATLVLLWYQRLEDGGSHLRPANRGVADVRRVERCQPLGRPADGS